MNDKQTGWVFFDGQCSFCRRWLQRTEKHLSRHGFRFEPLQTDWVADHVGYARGTIPEEMKVVTREGKMLGGIHAALHLARFIWWARPLAGLARVPGVLGLLDRLYRSIAKRRSCGKER